MNESKPDIDNTMKRQVDDLSIRMLMEKNMFDEYLYHVDVLYPVVPSLLKNLSRPRIKDQVQYRYIPLQESTIVKSYLDLKFPSKSSYGRACIKCHELKKKCIRIQSNLSQCIGCAKRDIKCVIRKDGRGARHPKEEKK